MGSQFSRRLGRLAATILLAGSCVIGWSATALGQAQQVDDSVMAELYDPVGIWEPGETIPLPSAPPADPTTDGDRPSEWNWNAYDVNVFESLALPGREPGDETDDDEPGNGGMPYGMCPPHPQYTSGRCDNHQLEYLDYYERAMKEILGDFGVEIKRYEFHSPGRTLSGADPYYTWGGQSSSPGRAINIAAVVPGADNPDETVLVSGHYDFTHGGPAAAWDSSEGHAQVLRMARIMASYWKRTGTRPSATIKFIPWDSEESGSYGSKDYVANNIPPGEEHKVRGYFNVDPCAGGYPAFRNGNPANRIPEVLQLGNPDNQPENSVARDRMLAFNTRAEVIVDRFLDYMDGTIATPTGEQPIYVSDSEAAAGANGGKSQRGEIVTALGGLANFSSDYASFEAAGIPIFNTFADMFGEHADGTQGSPEGLGILHTPRDNLTTLNALTSADQTGLTASEGWMEGMEMCAQLHAFAMLQPEHAGARPAAPSDAPVAYFEALPNEALKNQAITFDAGGSQQGVPGSLVNETSLEYSWSFGDGDTATGKVVQHAYDTVGRYTATLTVRNKGTGSSDTMTLPIEVTPSDFSPPELNPLPASDEDGDYELSWTAPSDREDVDHYEVEEARGATIHLSDDAEEDLSGQWTASSSHPDLQPWQASDSDAAKGSGSDKKRTGERSYWTGVEPQKWNPGPANAASTLTLNRLIAVPPGGETTLSYFEIFQSEGDDQGRVEVALEDGNPETPLNWQAVEVLQAIGATTGGAPHPWVWDPTNVEYTLTRPFLGRTVDLGAFKGKTIALRFNYLLGAENRAASQPGGWYLDDIKLVTGRWSPLGTSTGESIGVADRPGGSYAYRVRAVYADGVDTNPSNIEVITSEAPAAGGGDGEPTPPPTDGGSAGGGGGGGDSAVSGAGDGGTAAADQPAATGPRITVLGERSASQRRAAARKRALKRCLVKANRIKSKKRRAAAKRKCNRRYGTTRRR